MLDKMFALMTKLFIGPLETNLRSKIYFLSRPQNFATEVTLIQHPPPQSALATHRPFPCDPTPSFILQNLQRLYLGFPIIFCRYLLLFSDYVLLMPDQNFTVNGEIPITLHVHVLFIQVLIQILYPINTVPNIPAQKIGT